jgi:RNA polymerase primary sigma factor
MTKRYNNEDLEILKNYFKDIDSMDLDLLSPEEEVELAIRIQNGDDVALNKLVNANLKFVVSVASGYKNKGVSYSDLISEGNYGLVKAARRFDHTKGFRFISYAVWWIKQSILHCLNEHARTIRLPVNILNKIYQLQKEVGEEADAYERDKYMSKLPKCSSLDVTIDDNEHELSDIIEETPYTTHKDNMKVESEIRDGIWGCMDILEEREREIIINYYGLFDEEPKTLEVIGEEYGLTKERVRQIKSRAIKKLKFNLISIIKHK